VSFNEILPGWYLTRKSGRWALAEKETLSVLFEWVGAPSAEPVPGEDHPYSMPKDEFAAYSEAYLAWLEVAFSFHPVEKDLRAVHRLINAALESGLYRLEEGGIFELWVTDHAAKFCENIPFDGEILRA
jgi:hypothetical protein